MMNNQRKRSKTIASILTLTIVATMLMAFLPLTFGVVKLNMTANLWVAPDPVGVGQTIQIYGCLYPRPAFTGGQFGDVYHDVEFTINKPDGTTETRIVDTDDRAEYWFTYVPDQLGEWSVYMNWNGDDLREDDDDTERFTVQSEPVTIHEYPDESYSYVSTVPKTTLGQGQYIYIVGWVSPPPVLSGGIYRDLQFVVTKPDGSKETYVSDTNSEASTSYSLACDQLGTWSVTVNFAGDARRDPSTSPPWIWTVTAEPTPVWQEEPIPDPNMQWKYPISSEYRDWWWLSGAWPMDRYDLSTNFNPYTKGPDTPHILWKKPMDAGGVVGGELGSLAYTSAAAPTCVAAQGRLFYSEVERWIGPDGRGSNHPIIVCLDMATGEEIYRRDMPGSGNGNLIAIEQESRLKIDPKLGIRPSEVFSIWLMNGGTWEIDGWTGECLWFDDDMPGGAFYNDGTGGAIYSANWPESGTLTKFSCRDKDIIWQKPVGWNRTPYGTDWIWENKLVDRGSRTNGGPPYGVVRVWDTVTGDHLVTGPGSYEQDDYPGQGGWGDVLYNNKIYRWAIDGQVHAYSLDTGEEVWVSEQKSDNPWGIWGAYTASAAYGMVFFQPWDGYIYANDAETGALKWKFYCGDSIEVAAGHNVPWGVMVIADGKCYVSTGEHTTPNPPPRGNMLYCLDAYTGEELWSYPLMYRTRAAGIAYGKLWYNDRYDGSLYMFGKGPSATTVSASPSVIAKGASVLIQGTVMDQSAGAMDTPCVSKDSMAAWMLHLYGNKPEPADTVGVPVLLQAMSSDYNVIDIGVVTSDMKGKFERLWTPPDEDTYKILATFTGDESYFSSWEETALGVTAAPSPAVPIEPEPTAGLGITEIAIIAAVVVAAIVGIVAFWALKKRQ